MIKRILFAATCVALAACANPNRSSSDTNAASSTAATSGRAATALGGATASAALRPTQGQRANGSVKMAASDDGGTLVVVELRGMQPGSVHGLHIHEKGDCSAPDASSAGGHFNPDGSAHGAPSATPHHAGDLGNVTADANGVTSTRLRLQTLSFDEGPAGVIGRSVILHERADDLHSQPSGDSGGRIACGVIRRDVAAGTVGLR